MRVEGAISSGGTNLAESIIELIEAKGFQYWQMKYLVSSMPEWRQNKISPEAAHLLSKIFDIPADSFIKLAEEYSGRSK